jgi:hypothetical protein
MDKFTGMMSPEFIAQTLDNPLQNEKCEQMHAGSCNDKALSQFLMGCRGVYKMYLLVHLIPLLTLKRKKLMEKYKTHYLVLWLKSKNSLLASVNRCSLREVLL